MLRYVEDLDAVRERAQVAKDELAAMLADRMNRNMYTLSIVAAICVAFIITVGGVFKLIKWL
jgi:zinc transporter